MTYEPKFNPDGSIKIPDRLKDKTDLPEEETGENDPFYYEIVNRIQSIIEKEFGDRLEVKKSKTMSTLFTKKPLISLARCRFLYWVDFKENYYKKIGKRGIRVHLQKVGEQFRVGSNDTEKERLKEVADYDDPEKRLCKEISFKGSQYACLVIDNSSEMDDYFERLIKFTYGMLVEEQFRKIVEEFKQKRG